MSLAVAYLVEAPPDYLSKADGLEPEFDHVDACGFDVPGIGPTELIVVNGMACPHEDRAVFESHEIIVTLSLVTGWWFGLVRNRDPVQVRFEAGVVVSMRGSDVHWLHPTGANFATERWIGLQWRLPSKKRVGELLHKLTGLWGGTLVDPERWGA